MCIWLAWLHPTPFVWGEDLLPCRGCPSASPSLLVIITRASLHFLLTLTLPNAHKLRPHPTGKNATSTRSTHCQSSRCRQALPLCRSSSRTPLPCYFILLRLLVNSVPQHGTVLDSQLGISLILVLLFSALRNAAVHHPSAAPASFLPPLCGPCLHSTQPRHAQAPPLLLRQPRLRAPTCQ